jgi:Plasmid pRiA4b ORF-3-like protein
MASTSRGISRRRDRLHGQRASDQPAWRIVAVELAAPACQNDGMSADAIPVLRIELIDIEPLIWRRVAVKTATNLQTLHRIIQAVMGWLDYHLWSVPALGYRYMRERRFRLQRSQ